MAEDVKDSVIQKTQKVLGKHISKPTLTPKLLKKPPFRFLHDIVTSVIRETGFLKGLFTEQEMISENVKEREAKVAFLTKLIDALSAISGNEIDVKPGKIIAGLEATKTNKLLQILGSCLNKKLDSAEYISKLNSGDKAEKKSKKVNSEKSKTKDKESTNLDSNRKTEKVKVSKTDSKIKNSNEKLSKTSTDSTRKETKTNTDSTKKETKKNTDSTKKESKTKTKSNEKESIKRTNIKETDILQNEPTKTTNPIKDSDDIQDEKDVLKQEVEEVKEISLENQITHSNQEIQEPISQIRTNQPKEEEQTSIPREQSARIRPKSAKIQPEPISNAKLELKEINTTQTFLRPPSVRPMSARPGAPRLRPESALPTDQIIPLGNINVIVENYNNQDEEETVVIQSVEIPEEQPSVEDVLNIPQDKGHLVEQILEQINDVDDFAQMKNKKQDLILDTHSRDATQKEILQLQNLVQTLTKVANPLGKLMTYLHEDLDGMHSELMMWINMKKQAYGEIKKQKEQHNASNATLKQQLQDVEENIKKVEGEIAFVQSSILRNDVRIKQLLIR